MTKKNNRNFSVKKIGNTIPIISVFITKECKGVFGFTFKHQLIENNGLIFNSSVYRYERSFVELFITDVRICLRIRIFVEVIRDMPDRDLLILILTNGATSRRVAGYTENAISVWNTIYVDIY